MKTDLDYLVIRDLTNTQDWEIFPGAVALLKRTNKMKIRALGEHIFIQRLDGYGDYSLLYPDKDLGLRSIILPDSWRAKGQVGRVLGIGRGQLTNRGLIDLGIKVGDVVLFNPNAGSDIILDNKNILIINQSEVLAIL